MRVPLVESRALAPVARRRADVLELAAVDADARLGVHAYEEERPAGRFPAPVEGRSNTEIARWRESAWGTNSIFPAKRRSSTDELSAVRGGSRRKTERLIVLTT